MPDRTKFKNVGWLLIALSIVALDQWSKHLISSNFIPEQVIPILPFFSLVYTFNTGAAFSFLDYGVGWQLWLLGGLAFFVSIAIIRWLFVTRDARVGTKFALMLILGGAVGNLIDRIIYGHVRDFLYFFWQDIFSWPAFNIADSAITIGAIIYAIEIFRTQRKT